MSLELPASSGRIELEWPQEVVGFLEMGADSHDLVDQVLHIVDSALSEFACDNAVISERQSHSVDLAVTSLVDELSNGVSSWVSPSNPWLNPLDHVQSGFVQFNEHTVVDLSQSKELQDFLWLWVHLVDTTYETSKKHGIY